LYFVVAPASPREFDEGVWLVRLGRLHGISYGLWGVAVANVQQSTRFWIAWPTDRADAAPCWASCERWVRDGVGVRWPASALRAGCGQSHLPARPSARCAGSRLHFSVTKQAERVAAPQDPRL